MECIIREWKIEDAAGLAEMLNNKNILNNLRDGLPYPYTKSDAEEYIMSMLSADKTKTIAFAITIDDKVVGSIGVFRCENIHFRTAELGYYIGECVMKMYDLQDNYFVDYVLSIQIPLLCGTYRETKCDVKYRVRSTYAW